MGHRVGQLEFAATRAQLKIIVEIAKRAVALAEKHGVEYRQMDAMMDIEACISNGCPLKLEELLKADDGNFSHDVFGIRRHINRTTGVIEDCFLPRYADTEAMRSAA